MSFDRFFYEVLDNVRRYIESRPLHLGGSSGNDGGSGGRPGGYIGYLPQTRVAYDTSEIATSGTNENPSLLDNLNHIRYRLHGLETSLTVSGLTIEKNDVPIASNIRTIDFRGGVIVEAGTENDVNVFITLSGFEDSVFIPSGVYNVDLTNQINGSTNTFTINDTIIPTSLQVFLNGLQQTPSGVTTNSFSLDVTPQNGDVLFINYDKLVGIPAVVSLSHSSLSNLDSDDHPQYLNYSRATDYFYTEDEVDNLIAPLVSFSGLLPTNLGDLIVGNSTGTFSKLGVVPSGGLILVTDPSSTYGIDWREPSSLVKRLHQQIVFTIVGNNLETAEVKPIRIYLQELGSNARIDNILAYVNTPPQINDLRLRVLRNGVNIFSTYLEILKGENQKLMNTGFNDSIAPNDYFQLEVYQGDAFASDLSLHIRFSSEV